MKKLAVVLAAVLASNLHLNAQAETGDERGPDTQVLAQHGFLDGIPNLKELSALPTPLAKLIMDWSLEPDSVIAAVMLKSHRSFYIDRNDPEHSEVIYRIDFDDAVEEGEKFHWTAEVNIVDRRSGVVRKLSAYSLQFVKNTQADTAATYRLNAVTKLKDAPVQGLDRLSHPI